MADGLVRVLSCVLEDLVARNDQLPAATQITRFHAMKAPTISIQNYLERIVKYTPCSKECFVLALVYIDRVIQRNRFVLTSLNVHRFLITSIMLAGKFFDDCYYNNAYYAKVGGITGSEMNMLELEFLFLSNFSLNATPDIFTRYYHELSIYVVPAPLPLACGYGKDNRPCVQPHLAAAETALYRKWTPAIQYPPYQGEFERMREYAAQNYLGYFAFANA